MKTVLITGGSRGIGAAMVRLFAAEGYQTAFCYLHSEAAAQALSRETGALAVRCDVRREDEMQALFEGVLRRFHHLDAVIHNAGTAQSGLLQDMSAAQFDDLYQVHLRAAFFCAKYALPGMIARQSGSLLFLSSMWGQVGGACESAYSACKAGVLGLTRALAKEAGPSGVRVNALCPGVIDTDMMAAYSEADRAALAEETPLGRLGTPEDVARAALFLCSSDAAFITGQTLGVNGGRVVS